MESQYGRRRMDGCDLAAYKAREILEATVMLKTFLKPSLFKSNYLAIL